MRYDPVSKHCPNILKGCFAFLGGAPTVAAPAPLNLGTEMQQALQGYQETAPGYFSLNQQYQPAYGGLDLQLMQEQLQGIPAQGATTQTVQVPTYDKSGKRITGYTTQTVNVPAKAAVPGTLQQGIQATSTQRGADIADVMRYGPAATAAYLQANPYLAGSLGSLYQNTVDSPLLGQLNTQAQQALQQGGALSAQDLYSLNQQSLAGESAAGMATGNQAMGAELLNTDAQQRQRLAAAQQLATGVQQLDSSTLGGASQIFQQTLADPYQSILGRSSGAGLSGISGGGAGLSAIGSAALGQSLFNPQAGAQIAAQNQQNQLSANIANANAQAATNAGYLGLGGSALGASGAIIGGLAAGGAFSDKRIKTDIKKLGKKNGINIYRFRYKGSDKWFEGPMAQEVEKKKPSAVSEVAGFKVVDFAKAGVPLKRWNFMDGKVAA